MTREARRMSRDARLRRFQAQALADGAGGQRCPRCRATMIRPELYEIPHRAGWGLVEDPETGELEVVCLACRQEDFPHNKPCSKINFLPCIESLA